MELVQRQRLVQEQRLSPEQVQYYELLQKTALELQVAIDEELRTNPALEIDEMKRCASCGEILVKGEGCITCRPGMADKEDRKEVISAETLDYLDDFYSRSDDMSEASYYEKPDRGEEGRDKFAAAIRIFTLSDHLKAGLGFVREELDEREKLCARDLIDMVDENGFLPQTDESLALELGADPETITRLRRVISGIEPVGAGLKSSFDCLIRQLEDISARDGRDVTNECQIILHHLQDAAKEKFAKIAKTLRVPTKVVKEAFDFIKCELYSSPAVQLDLEGKLERGDNIYIEPEVRIYDEDGELKIELFETGMPQLKVSRFYLEAFNKLKVRTPGEFTGDEKKHIREHFYKAKKFIEHIHTRRDTILKIVSWLVNFQEDFIRKGPAHLKSLTREKLAGEVGFHPSTVTRSLKHRYAQFPDNSVKSFAVFFDSSQSVITEIKRILLDETPCKVFSDEEITYKLGERGFKLSRRAITKYRHASKIPSSGQRKRALKALAKERLLEQLPVLSEETPQEESTDDIETELHDPQHLTQQT